METQLLTETTQSPDAVITSIMAQSPSKFQKDVFDMYDPKEHKVMKDKHRKNKLVYRPTSVINPKTGEPHLEPEVVHVARIALALQKLIVKRCATFLTGGRVILKSNPEDDLGKRLYKAVREMWNNNKLQFRNSAIAKKMMSETECAEVWYSVEDKKKKGGYKMRCKLYSPSDGYKLYPVWDKNDDMAAFGIYREDTGDKKEYFWLYTATERREYVKDGSSSGVWREVEDAAVELQYGKIPVIYYQQPEVEWADVQSLIERLETLISNFADTNDYNGSPILFSKGKIKGFAAKGEAGKLIESTGENADLKYVTWEGAPEAIKLEISTLIDFIFTITQTPNITFEQMQKLGDISGVAFDRLFMDAHLKAKDRQEGEFGECIQRRLNFLKAAAIAIEGDLGGAKDLEVSAEFNLFRIGDTEDRVDLAMKISGGKTIASRRRAVEVAGLTDDPDDELKQIEEEEKAARPIVLLPQTEDAAA